MTTITQAVVIPEPGQVGLQTVERHDPGAGDVVVETVYTSISAGTERMLLAGQMPHPMLSLPVIPGYETVGRIAAVGDDVDDAWLGRWVYVGGARCYEGVNAAWGGQSATIVTGADRVVPIDSLDDPKEGVLLALAATALHGIDVLEPEGRTLVIGQGPVGQIAARLARQNGWVGVTDLNPKRLDYAVADEIVNVGEQPVTEAIEEPVTSIIEASGSMEALSEALQLLAPGGTILLLGYYQTLSVPYMPLFLKEARLLTAKEWAPGDLVRCRDMMANATLDLSPLLTHERPIEEVEAAYDIALNDDDCLKLVLNWSGGKQ